MGPAESGPAFPFGSGHFWTVLRTDPGFSTQTRSRLALTSRKGAGALGDVVVETNAQQLALPPRSISGIASSQRRSSGPAAPTLLAVADFDRTSHGMASGNVAAGTDLVQSGIDGLGVNGRVSTIFNGTIAVAVGPGAVTIDGYWGQLEIYPDGSFTYVRNAGVTEGDTEYFTYTLTDGTGATSQAVLQIDLLPLVAANFDSVSNIYVGSVYDEAIDASALSGPVDGLAGDDQITGGTGYDDLRGGGGDDILIGAGGDDMLTAGAGIEILDGGAGNDLLQLESHLTAADRIDGGTGNDSLVLDGDYSAGVTLAADTIVNVDSIVLTAGHGYKLVLNDATSTTPLTVNGSALGAGESVIVDGSAETSAQLILAGGAGDDMLIGGAGINIFVSGAGIDTLTGGGAIDQYTLRGNLTAADQIDGKAGNDVVTLNGDYSAGIVFTATTMVNVEFLQLTGAFDYQLTFDDATATPTMTINGNGITGGHHLHFDGSAETSAIFLITGSKSDDIIFSGGGNDKITANGGDDTISTGGGDDRITLQSTLTAADNIDGGTGNDTLVLSGDYSAGITFDANTVTNVELIQLGINSCKLILHDGTNDSNLWVIGSSLSTGQTLYIDGSAESSAALTVTGGDGGNTLVGGGGNDSFTGGSSADLLIGGAGDNIYFGYGGADIFSIDGSASGINVIYDFILDEGTSLHITDVLDGAGDDIQDLIDAGFSAYGTGTDCIIGNGTLTIYMYGFGGTVIDLNDLSTLMGSQLVVAH